MQLKVKHPIAKDSGSEIMTEAALKAYADVVRMIRNGVPGCMITGRNRVGKSIAIKLIASKIENDFPDQIAVFTTIVKVQGKTSQGDFYRRILTNMGVSFTARDQVSVLEDLVVSAITMEGMCNENNAVLLIDEASNMTVNEYLYLMNIYNRVKDVGIDMTTVLVGTPNLIKMKERLKDVGQTQVVARFMSRAFEFSPVSTPRNLQIILSAYDGDLEYDGKSYTEYFFPEAYANGKRLSDWSRKVYEMFRSELGGARVKNVVITMQHLILTIRIMFLKCGALGEGKEWIDENDWKEAITESGFKEDMLSGDI